jgi:DNA polymerase I-like protein with 3'-5' exonuclease and polymerase domains
VQSSGANKETVEKKYALLTPQKLPRRENLIEILPTIENPATDSRLHNIFNNRPSTFEPMALDFETKGSPTEPGSTVVGVGLADSRGSWYVDLRDSHPSTYKWIIDTLAAKHVPLIAHNVYFDAMWIVRDHKLWLNWKACTYALYKLLATEGWPGQRWGLKDAQIDLLGWETTNEAELDDWLIANGYGDEYTDKKTGQLKKRPDKGEMWRAPAPILGKYCALDADSTYLFFKEILEPVLKRFKALNIYSTVWYPKYERILIEQTLSGICIDRDRLHAHSQQNLLDLEVASKEIYSSTLLRPHLDRFNLEVLAELQKAEPPRYLKTKERPPEPPKFTKGGIPSRAWEKWRDNEGKYVPVVSKNWLTWQEKYKAALNEEHFNFNSYPQKKRLFYEMLFPNSKTSQVTRDRGDRQEVEDVFRLVTPEREVLLPLTKSGGVPVDRKALKQMDAVGRLFLTYNDLIKEQQFIEALLENSVGGVLHPQFRVPGTLTGRLAGGGGKRKGKKGFNIQQVPKSPGFLRCFIPRPGHTFVDCDHTALEQVVLAELSRDETLLKLYGPNATNKYSLDRVTHELSERGIKWEIVGEELVVYED